MGKCNDMAVEDKLKLITFIVEFETFFVVIESNFQMVWRDTDAEASATLSSVQNNTKLISFE